MSYGGNYCAMPDFNVKEGAQHSPSPLILFSAHSPPSCQLHFDLDVLTLQVIARSIRMLKCRKPFFSVRSSEACMSVSLHLLSSIKFGLNNDSERDSS
jgi:hypothetical protein